MPGCACGHAAAFEYSQRFDARLAQLTQPVALIVIEDGSKESGLFKFSAREITVQNGDEPLGKEFGGRVATIVGHAGELIELLEV